MSYENWDSVKGCPFCGADANYMAISEYDHGYWLTCKKCKRKIRKVKLDKLKVEMI